MTSISQNGYSVLFTNRTTGPLPRLRKYSMPFDVGPERHFYLRDGSTGFLLVHMLYWYHLNIEPLNRPGTVWDEWGWAVRPVIGQSTGYSNHASGTAADENATEHPRGVTTSRTFSNEEIAKIHLRLRMYEGCIRWGGDYSSVPDGMHFEIDKPLDDVERVARKILEYELSQDILDANKGLKAVILS